MKKNIIENKKHTAKNIRFLWRDKKMKGEEIVERGLIAYCVIMFSEHTMLDIVMAEQLKEEVK
jgi:hypothetical protein